MNYSGERDVADYAEVFVYVSARKGPEDGYGVPLNGSVLGSHLNELNGTRGPGTRETQPGMPKCIVSRFLQCKRYVTEGTTIECNV